LIPVIKKVTMSDCVRTAATSPSCPPGDDDLVIKQANLYVGVAVVTAAALNGIAVLRAYLLLFTGARHVSAVALGIVPRERLAVLTLSLLIFGGGLFPQPGMVTRHRAAEEIMRDRQARQGNAQTRRNRDFSSDVVFLFEKPVNLRVAKPLATFRRGNH